MSGHDPFFKTLLRSFFPDFLALAAPGIAVQLDLSRQVFLDKEFFGDGGRGRREADLLVMAPLRRDGGRAVLVHVEIESRARRGMGRRLWRYRNRILAVYEGDVLSVVLYLRGGPPGVTVVPMEDDPVGPELGELRYVAFGLAASRRNTSPGPSRWPGGSPR